MVEGVREQEYYSMTNNPKDAIRLTNRTARALRAQAKAQRTALYALATVVSIALCAVAVIVGIQHLVAVPLCVLAAIALDAVIILLAKGRYLSLTGQAICTEAAARQMRDETAQAQRVKTAARDLEKIKEDLVRAERHDKEEDDEEDEDMRAPAAVRKLQPVRILEDEEEATREMQPVTRRRRQARLQVFSSDDAQNRAN